MNPFPNLFSRKLAPEKLIDESAKICEEAFIEASKKTLESTKDSLSHLLTAVLPGISAILAANFVFEAVTRILVSLVSREHTAEIQRSLNTLLAGPMRAGIDQLRIGLKISASEPK